MFNDNKISCSKQLNKTIQKMHMIGIFCNGKNCRQTKTDRDVIQHPLLLGLFTAVWREDREPR